MPNFAPERGDDARLALQDVVRDYGPSGLDNPKIFAQVLPDLLAGAPLATNVLNVAAAAGVGRLLSERIAAAIPPTTAVRDVAHLLSQRSALDISAAQWVVAEYARVLGHAVDDAALAAMAPPPPMPPVHQMPMQAPPPPMQVPQPMQVPPPMPAPPYAPGQPVSGQPVSGQPVSGQPVSGQPVSGQPVSGQPVSGQPVSGQPVSGQPVSPAQVGAGQGVPTGMAAGGIPPGGGMAAAGPGDPKATQLDAGTPGQAPPPRISGRATAKVQPNRGRVLDDTAPFTVPGPAEPGYPPQPQPGYPPQPQPGYLQQPGYPQQPGYGPYGPGPATVKRSKTPWIVGGVLVALVAAAVIAIVLVNGQKKCTGTGCQAGPTHGPTVPVTTPPVSPPVTPSTTPPPPSQVTLSQVMPKDIDVSTCGPDTANTDLMSNVTDSLACKEDSSSSLPNATVLGFQFGNQQDYAAGIDQLNSHTGIDPSNASDSCPPGGGHDTGVSTWHRGDSGPSLGKLECFTDTDQFNYFIWTDDNELIVEIVKGDAGQTFVDINDWWEPNNNNGTGP